MIRTNVMDVTSAGIMGAQNLIDWLRDPELLLNHLLSAYGVWMLAIIALIVFIESGVLFPVLPGDSMLFAIGLLQDRMPVSLPVICGVLIVAAICGAQVGYWFGLLFGGRFFKPEARILKTEYLDTSRLFFEKWGGPAVVLGRFIPFVRTFVPIAAGMGRYRWAQFTLWNVVGSVLWTLTFIVAGVLLGDIPLVRNNVELIAVLIIIASVLPIGIGLLKKRFSKGDDKIEAPVS